MANSKQKDDKKYQQYDQLVKDLTPNSRYGVGYFRAFWVGGVICTIGQLVAIASEKWLGMDESSASMLTSIVMIFLGTILTGFGIYDDIGKYAGAGSVVPITGFANSVAAPAMEFRKEGLILGLGAKIFTLAGPVLLYGIIASIVVGLAYLVIGG